eukprot:m.173068 g.173068  ORF g.173068 m.173068 type:complete len:269 (+) comp31715_c0_seq1:35-841(+)
MASNFDQDTKAQARLYLLWRFFGATVILGLIFTTAMQFTFCWSTGFLGFPLIVTLLLVVRVSCNDFCCMKCCPDAPTDVIELTRYFDKALLVHMLYFFVMLICNIVSMAVSKQQRSICGDDKCVPQELTEEACDKECGCSEATFLTVGLLATANTIFLLVGVVLLRNFGNDFGSLRRTTQFDRLHEINSSDEESEDEEASLHTEPTAQELKLKGFAKGMLSSIAPDEGADDNEDGMNTISIGTADDFAVGGYALPPTEDPHETFSKQD